MIFEKHITIQDIELCFPTVKMAKGLCDVVLNNQSEFKYIDHVQKLTNIPECEKYLITN